MCIEFSVDSVFYVYVLFGGKDLLIILHDFESNKIKLIKVIQYKF